MLKEAQLKALEVCEAAGLDDVRDFDELDVTLIHGLHSLHPDLQAGIRRLPAFAAKLVADQRAQSKRPRALAPSLCFRPASQKSQSCFVGDNTRGGTTFVGTGSSALVEVDVFVVST